MSTHRLGIAFTGEDLARMKELQASLHCRSRSELIRRLIEQASKREETRKKIDRCAEAYRKYPEDPKETEAMAKHISQQYEKEDWGESR